MKQLVLFDIDGTLIYHIGTHKQVGFPRFLYAIKKVFGVEAVIDPTVNYNGWVDKQIVEFIVQPYGISPEQVKQKFPDIGEALHKYADEQAQGGQKLYVAIADAVTLARLLKNQRDIVVGLLTGNVERMARWKLSHAGVPELFQFGLFGDDADNRIALAQSVFVNAQKYFGIMFKPENVVVIGDAIGDVRCGKAIGARTILVMTGNHSPKEVLAAEHPDLLIETLMDRNVLDMFGLDQHKP